MNKLDSLYPLFNLKEILFLIGLSLGFVLFVVSLFFIDTTTIGFVIFLVSCLCILGIFSAAVVIHLCRRYKIRTNTFSIDGPVLFIDEDNLISEENKTVLSDMVVGICKDIEEELGPVVESHGYYDCSFNTDPVLADFKKTGTIFLNKFGIKVAAYGKASIKGNYIRVEYYNDDLNKTYSIIKHELSHVFMTSVPVGVNASYHHSLMSEAGIS